MREDAVVRLQFCLTFPFDCARVNLQKKKKKMKSINLNLVDQFPHFHFSAEILVCRIASICLRLVLTNAKYAQTQLQTAHADPAHRWSHGQSEISKI